MSLNRKVVNQCVLSAMAYGCQTWCLTKAKKLETSQRAMERKMPRIEKNDTVNVFATQDGRAVGRLAGGARLITQIHMLLI